jgi:hypothetical protein
MNLICVILLLIGIGFGAGDINDPDCVPFGNRCVPFKEAAKDASIWLRERLPPWDKDNEMSLFGNPIDDVDGLGNGIVGVGINASLTAKSVFPWARDIPRDYWYDYNLAYCTVNEARNNWRPYLHNKTLPLLKGLSPTASIAEVVNTVNAGLWSALGYNGDDIYFKSSQTPLIYDPLSTITFGYASCTGISILLVDALRSVGVCARVAGTPAWHHNPEEGNHNWLEVLYKSEDEENGGWSWGIIEGNPAATGETIQDPCDKWFCNAGHFGTGNASTPIYASRFDKFAAKTFYRMSWDMDNVDVPGDDRSEYYNRVCPRCTTNPNKVWR